MPNANVRHPVKWLYSRRLEHIRCSDVEVAVIDLIATRLGDINQAPIITHIDTIVLKHRNTSTQPQTKIKTFQAVRREGIGLGLNARHGHLIRSEQTHAKIGAKRAEDADITLQLKEVLEKELKENGAEKLFYEIEMPLVPVLAYMEKNGVRVDTEALKETSRHFTAHMKQIEEEVHLLADMDFNISSPKQVGEVLFDKLRIVDKAKKTKTGQYVTSEEVLESLRSKHPIVEKILDYRGLKKLLSTYIDALPLLINPETGKIHTSFNQTVTATGRLSSSNPNLQNIPIRNEDGKEIRKAFIPEEGCEFFSADYSQIELRIMAHLSDDKNMIEAFREGDDIHAATAAKVYKVALEEVSREQRSKAKTANFGIIYGISVFGLAERMNVSRSEAKELIETRWKSSQIQICSQMPLSFRLKPRLSINLFPKTQITQSTYI